MGRAREAANKWLNEQGIIDELTDADYEEVRKLVGLRSFGIFWALLRWRRERSVIALQNASLGSAERDCHASVLQGHIRGVDEIRELILDIAEPPADAAANQEQTDGRTEQ